MQPLHRALTYPRVIQQSQQYEDRQEIRRELAQVEPHLHAHYLAVDRRVEHVDADDVWVCRQRGGE